ncbi:MAG: glycosyltransferase [Chloroflexi bacterium]|nr:glycosyltransferase [Chloroflexota bacterium]
MSESAALDRTGGERLRILLISRCPPLPLYLGDRLIVYHLARELGARGHEIDLLAFDDESAPPDPDAYRHLFGYQNIFPDPPRGMVEYGRRALVASKRFPTAPEEAWSPEMWRAIRKLITRRTYDIAHLFGGVQVYEYRRAVEPLPALITPYESYSLYLKREIATGGGLGVRVRYLAARAYESFMFNPFRRVVVLTDRDREMLLRINPYLSVEVIPNGVDLDVFSPPSSPPPRTPNTLLFTGNFEYEPNLDAAFLLIEEILPLVKARIPDAVLWLQGANPPEELLEMAGEDVVITGKIPDMRVPLSEAAVFACPLRMGAGIKNKVLEAMAMGCPVVATPLSLDGIAARDGESALVAEGQPEVFAAAIVRALSDEALRQRLSEGGRKVIVDGYNWKTVADRYEALYRDVIRLG